MSAFLLRKPKKHHTVQTSRSSKVSVLKLKKALRFFLEIQTNTMNTDELEFESDSEVGEDMDLDRIPEDQEEDSDEVTIM